MEDFYFLRAFLYCQYNCQYLPYCLTFSLNNETLRELYYLYGKNKTKHNLYCKRYNENGILLHCFPNVSTTMRTFHVFIMTDPATLLPNSILKKLPPIQERNTQCLIRGGSYSLSYRAHKEKKCLHRC